VKRLECLDGLRGVLALYVLLSHMVPFAVLPGWLAHAMSHGGAGVDVFFTLSGLVIVRSLESFRYRARPFLIARTARIFPVFLVVFALAIAVQPLDPGFARMPWIVPDSLAWKVWFGSWPTDWLADIATHLTMTHGMLPNGVLPFVWLSFLISAWSLSTEWQFYVLVTLLGVGFGGGTCGLRRLAGVLLAIAVLGHVWGSLAPEAWCFSRAFLPNKAQYFALGVASAVLVRDPASRRHFLLVLAATLALSFAGGGGGGIGAGGGGEKLLPPLVWTLCLAVQLRPDLAPLRPLSRALCSPPLLWLGAVSYCLYLVHEPVQKLLGIALAWFAGGNATLFTAIWLPTAILLPLLAAWWLHVAIEVPALRYGHRVAKRALVAPGRGAPTVEG
jgi:peptidoglycan/LPS O-acetylase OafA/YrhL